MNKIIIDTDPGVDDAIAILLALAHPALDVLALTTVVGNASVAHTTNNALGILNLAGALDVPVYQGIGESSSNAQATPSDAHGDNGMGGVRLDPGTLTAQSQSAPEYLVEVINAHPNEITLVPVGPMTNIAQAIALDPSIAGKTKRLVMMGGAEGTGNITPSAEFNFWCDPGAADVVMRAGFQDVVMVGLDATSQVFMSPGTRDLLRYINTPVSTFMYEATQEYADFYWNRRRLVGSELCDALAIAYLIDEAIMDTVPAHVELCVDGLCAGRSVVARTARYRDRTPNALVGTTVDTRGFFSLLFTTLFPDHAEDIQTILAIEYR